MRCEVTKKYVVENLVVNFAWVQLCLSKLESSLQLQYYQKPRCDGIR